MEIRDITDGDLPAVLDERRRAYGPVDAAEAERWKANVRPYLGQRRYLGVFDGDRLMGTARLWDFRQWWHGRALSLGGVASVAVSPEERGRGVGRFLMRGVLDRCAELGHLASALYPMTTPLYRGLGWEHAGARYRVTLPTEALRPLAARDARAGLRRIGAADAAEVIATLDRVHAATRATGPIAWDENITRMWLGGENTFAYLAEDGFVVYRWQEGGIEIDNLVAGSAATARALWALVGGASSAAPKVTASVEPDDPMLWLVRERDKDTVAQTRWMFRLVDLPAAVAARGYPAGVRVDTVVEVDDPQRPANSGAWRLTVSGGQGGATPAGAASLASTAAAIASTAAVSASSAVSIAASAAPDAAPDAAPGGGPGGGPDAGRDGRAAAPGEVPRLTIGGFSALFAGVRPQTLRRAGLLAGGTPDSDELLGAAFAAKPYMLDYF
ncbi:hypothetical protein Sru01_58140 [Sphaerisporangium rufum]|uniref:N-acetyltransferase domain-containing protein n=1 Tax=Sphaerisporangium rufum TaxID=1381558 RepID=A0A919V3H7_9ACTN|nr:GNAT family N-acetyltransferase [Sphaerisporangium rufum]GII80832.1 hypothetical protein Sru01_58140 [Sphaerisporangium rufum]